MSDSPVEVSPAATDVAASPSVIDTTNPGGFKHILALDGVRGAAILIVLYDHLFWANSVTTNKIIAFFNAIRSSSYVGVNLFFALSGFLITGILINTVNKPRYFKDFYARRSLRIFPLYYGVLFLLLALTKPMHFVWHGGQWFYLAYVKNIPLFIYHFDPVLPHVNINHFWSLQVEEQFYLVWPVIVYRVRRLKTLLTIALVVCVLVLLTRTLLLVNLAKLGNDIYLVYSPTFSTMDNLLWGCSLAVLLRTRLREKVMRAAPWVFAIGMAILVWTGYLHQGLPFTHSFFIPTVGFSIVGITATALIAMALMPGTRTQRLFENPLLRFYGRYSYGIYVFHYTLQETLGIAVRTWVDEHTSHKILGVLSGAAVVLTSATIVALISYHCYEKHFLKLKRYFTHGEKGEPQDLVDRNLHNLDDSIVSVEPIS